MRSDGLERGDGIERAAQELGKLAVREPTRLEVEPPQRTFDPAHALLERVEAGAYGRATPPSPWALLRYDDEEAPVEDPPRSRKLVE